MCCRFWPENYQHDDFKACLRNYLTQCITIFNKRERRYPRCHDIDIHSKSWRGKEHKAGLPRGDPPPTGNSAGAASAARSCSGWPRLTTTYLLHHHCSTCTMHHVLVPCNDRCGAIAEIWWRGFRARTLVSAALAPSTSFSYDCFSGSLPPHSVCDSTKIDTLQPASL